MLLSQVSLAAPNAVLAVSERTEARVRSTDGAVAMDIETGPALTLEVRHRLFSHRWTAGARFSALDLSNPTLGIYGNAGMSASFRPSSRCTFIAAQDFGYGQIATAALLVQNVNQDPGTNPGSTTGGTPGSGSTSGGMGGTGGTGGTSASVQALPGRDVLLYLQSRSSLGFFAMPERRWSVAGNVSFALTGGLGANADSMPLQRAYRVDSTVSNAPTGRDSLGFGLVAQRIEMPSVLRRTTVPQAEPTYGSGALTQLDALASYDRRLARNSTWRIVAGASLYEAISPHTGEQRVQLVPIGESMLRSTHRRGSEQAVVEGTVAIAPVIDRLSGEVDFRLQGGLNATYGWDVLSFRVTTMAARSIGAHGPMSTTLLMGAVGVILRPNKTWQLEVGVREMWRYVEPYQGQPESSSTLASGYCVVTFQPSPIAL